MQARELAPYYVSDDGTLFSVDLDSFKMHRDGSFTVDEWWLNSKQDEYHQTTTTVYCKEGTYLPSPTLTTYFLKYGMKYTSPPPGGKTILWHIGSLGPMPALAARFCPRR